MTVLYVAAPGRLIPNGWPEDGRPIDPLSQFHRRMVKDGDLIVKPEGSKKKDDADGK